MKTLVAVLFGVIAMLVGIVMMQRRSLRQHERDTAEALQRANSGSAFSPKQARVPPPVDLTVGKEPVSPQPEVSPAAPQTGPTLAKGLIPADALKYAGRATPRAAAESLYWAVNGGDTQALSELMLLSGEARTVSEKLRDRLPAETRVQTDAPEDALSLYLGAGFPVVDGMQILAESQGAAISEGFPPELGASELHKTVHVQVQFKNGDVREHRWVFQNVDGEWRWMVPPYLANRASVYARVKSGGRK